LKTLTGTDNIHEPFEEDGMPREKEKDEYSVIMSDAVRNGDYSNFVKIQHTAVDFRMDFAKIVPEENTINVSSRQFMSPIHAKMFMRALMDNIEKYERQFGVVELKSENPGPASGITSREKH
jgi:hypothetical protein